MSTQLIVKEYIAQEIMRGRNHQLNPTDDLLAVGILDSLGILQLVAFMEEKFGVKVPDEDVVYENFHSISAISSYVESLQQQVAR
jgi:acyl carrier protein